jgi:hypothetical protein
VRISRVLALLGMLLIFATASAAPSANESSLRAEDEVTLVIHTAVDCPICKAWRESSSGLAVAQQFPNESPPVKLVFIERTSLHGSESEALYPAQLLPLFKARQEKYQLSPPVPLFELVRGERVISRHAGLRGWSEGTLPEVRQVQGKPVPSAVGR